MDPVTKAFVADIHGFIAARSLELVSFAKGQRKDDLTQRYLARFTDAEGVLFVGRAWEKAGVWGSRSVRTFGDTLRQLRTEAGLTQDDLAKQVNWSQSQISRAEQNLFIPDDATVQRLDRALDGGGRLVAAYATVTTSSAELVHPGRDPLVFSDLLRKIHRTDVGRDTIDQLTVITEQLCCEYVSRRPEELREDAHHQLEYIQRLLEGPIRLSEHRELLVIAGWLSLLIGCVNYDLGLARHGTPRLPAPRPSS